MTLAAPRTVILAGGFGTRLTEETENRPKPMIDIGGHPLLWHVMSVYGRHGFCDFIVACGYKGEVIKEYFHDYYVRNRDYVVSLRDGQEEVLPADVPDWRVAIVDTGLHTMTGGRLRRLRSWLAEQTFMVTYGDGVADVDVRRLLSFHREHGKLATVTGVRPPARFGGLVLDGARVREFSEKPQVGEGWINGGFFVFEPAVLDYMTSDDTVLERDPLERLAAEGQLIAYLHEGFWQCVDTLREKRALEQLWNSGRAPWRR